MTDILTPRVFRFSHKTVDVYFDAAFAQIDSLVPPVQTIFITDENVHAAHLSKFEQRKVIVMPAGECHKNQKRADAIIDQLIAYGADRNTFIVGVGGGVITDISGYVASVFMRGISFGFVPTSILAMVDACIGGKNGVDVGVYKNLVGVINQPKFLLYDFTFLQTLSEEEWRSGFAEIVKHACIRDADMFSFLEGKSLADFQSQPELVASLVQRNAELKYAVVAADETENGERRLLNFGHTIGHAIENIHSLLHGYAISLGIIAACHISEQINGLHADDTTRIRNLLLRYGLPVDIKTDTEKAWDILVHDKKKSGNDINFVVLDRVGNASVKKIPLQNLRTLFDQFS